MDRAEFPILEHDPNPTGLFGPPPNSGKAPPEAVVLCFFREVIEAFRGDGRLEEIYSLTWEDGPHPLFQLDTEFGLVGVMHPGVGSPMAVGMLEAAIVCGCRYFVACGGAGALRPGLALGHVIVPSRAIRDEGTSFHYMEPSREVELEQAVIDELVAVLVDHGVPHHIGKTWTTDAPYRETSARIARRREEGSVTVEMETAALAAAARFRDVRFGQYLYAGDDVSGEARDRRDYTAYSGREGLFWLAVEAAARLQARCRRERGVFR